MGMKATLREVCNVCRNEAFTHFQQLAVNNRGEKGLEDMEKENNFEVEYQS